MPTLEETARQFLALPREAGTPEAAKAREIVADHLRYLGFNVVSQHFSFAPSALRAFPILGAGLGGLGLLSFPFLVSDRAAAWAALVVWMGGLGTLIIVAAGIGLGWTSLGEALRHDANLIATRGDSQPTRWIVAHLDSKAQAQSMAGRLVAVWMVGAAIAALTILSLIRLQAPLPGLWAASAVALALAAGLLAVQGRMKGRSRGARDNGTGVVAALAAAAASGGSVGILITGAEEFGLVGSRVFARLTPNISATEFVNFDTIDQEGRLYLVSHDASGERLADSLEPHLAGLDLLVERRRLPLGIFVDSAPLARAHAPAVTIGRLTWRTLRCIHTPADTPEGLSFRAAEQVGKTVGSLSLVPRAVVG